MEGGLGRTSMSVVSWREGRKEEGREGGKEGGREGEKEGGKEEGGSEGYTYVQGTRARPAWQAVFLPPCQTVPW